MTDTMVTAKSCSRCGNRRRSEENPNGHYLIAPYWDRSQAICQQCCAELVLLHDKNEDWPADPLDEDGNPTIVGPGGVSMSELEPEKKAEDRGLKDIPIPGWTTGGKEGTKGVKVDCQGGPMHASFLACYATYPLRVPLTGGYYEYHQGKYIWRPEA